MDFNDYDHDGAWASCAAKSDFGAVSRVATFQTKGYQDFVRNYLRYLKDNNLLNGADGFRFGETSSVTYSITNNVNMHT